MRRTALNACHLSRSIPPVLGLAFVMAFAACSFAPDYKQPELDVPQSHTVAASTDSIPYEWWTLFGDTTLDNLVAEALNANQDLAAAAARVEQARALAGVAKAELYPVIRDGGSGSRTDRVAKDRIRLIDQVRISLEEPSAHADGLGTLSGEHEYHCHELPPNAIEWGRKQRFSSEDKLLNSMAASPEGREGRALGKKNQQQLCSTAVERAANH